MRKQTFCSVYGIRWVPDNRGVGKNPCPTQREVVAGLRLRLAQIESDKAGIAARVARLKETLAREGVDLTSSGESLLAELQKI
jgi:hypothetical protein